MMLETHGVEVSSRNKLKLTKNKNRLRKLRRMKKMKWTYSVMMMMK
jgi:hypothetical protein